MARANQASTLQNTVLHLKETYRQRGAFFRLLPYEYCKLGKDGYEPDGHDDDGRRDDGPGMQFF